jgi:ABC-type ATPase involved in cell division
MQTNSEPDAPRDPVMQLCGVTFKGKADPATMLINASVAVQAKALVMWHLDRSQTTRDIASMMLGLQFPARGDVMFESQDWLGNDFDRHFAMRSRIGRVFDDQAWIANLNLIENVRLSAEHHGRSTVDVDEDVRRWCDHFSVSPVARERPAFVNAARLQIYQWVRALVTRPRFLLLERPMQSVASSWRKKLWSAIDEVRFLGTAVLWMTANRADADADLGDNVLHCQLDRGELRQSADLRDIVTEGR